MRHGTYSIVAFDPETGEHGAAVHSHWFSVGSLCIWARPGIGAVATQSVVEPAHGPHGLDRLAAGDSAEAALRALLGPDELAAVRQVGIVDGAGEVAVHTGESCIPCAGHATGVHVSAQANMMERETVPVAMVAGFEAATGDLAERLMAALHAAEGEGGDVRGRQSAALVVVPREGEAWRARFELRVEDHAEPVEELGRLLRLARAYELAGEADELMASDRPEDAGVLYLRAAGAGARVRRAAVLGRPGAGARRRRPDRDGRRARARSSCTRAGSRCSSGSRRTSPLRASGSGESCEGSDPCRGAAARRRCRGWTPPLSR